MTFSVPEEIAGRLIRQVPARDRSRYVTEALRVRLRQEDEQILRSCVAANADPDIASLELEMEAIDAAVAEPWDDAKAR